jgi:hypothetical protein
MSGFARRERMHVDVQLEEAVNYGQLPNRLLTAFEVADKHSRAAIRHDA